MRIGACVFAILVGCSSKAASVPSQRSCSDRAAAFGAWMRELAAEGRAGWPFDSRPPQITPVVLDAAPSKLPVALDVTLAPDGVFVRGERLDLASPAARQHADQVLSMIDELALVVDAAAPWSEISSWAASAAATKRHRVAFVFAAGRPAHVPAPEPSSIDAELTAAAKLPPGMERSQRYARALSTVVEHCDAAIAIYARVGRTNPADVDELYVDGFPKAVAACDCHIDVPAMQRLMWSAWRRDVDAPHYTSIAVELANDGAVVTAPATARWAETYKLIVAAAKTGRPVRIE